MTRSAGDWTSSSAPTPGVGKAHHATAISLLGMVATAVSSEGPSSETWMSSSAPTHGVGKAHHVIAGSPIDMARYRDFIRGPPGVELPISVASLYYK